MNLLEQLGLSPEVLIAILGAGNIVSIPSSMPEGRAIALEKITH
jgi:hypothetical protein